MPLEPPKLDRRTFADLVAEARERIPRYTPEWTNLNDSDPGMTLVKLNAWLAETVLYELNRVPELTYVKFLKLLQVRPRPARAAHTELAFTLAKLADPRDPLRVLVPKGSVVAVDDPDLEEEVAFETGRTLTATNAAVAAMIVANPEETPPRRLATTWDPDKATTSWLPAAPPFEQTGDVAWLALVLRPHLKPSSVLDDYSQDVFPAGELDLWVEAAGPGDEVATGATPVPSPLSRDCPFPFERAERAAGIAWAVYTGTDPDQDFTADDAWTALQVVGDETAGLTRSGHLRLVIPERLARASMTDLPRTLWVELGLKKPPRKPGELVADLGDPELDLHTALVESDPDGERILADAGLPAATVNELLNACTSGPAAAAALKTFLDGGGAVDPAAVAPARWLALEAGYDAPPTPVHKGAQRPLVWLRLALTADDPPPPLRAIRLNTVPATAAVTRLDERLGTSDGRPAQRFTLAKTPVFIDPATGAPDLELEVAEALATSLWTRVDDFYRQGPDSEVYTLAPETGEIAFGDGTRGRIPVAGARVRAVRYRFGGGAVANTGPDTVTKLKGALRHVDRVTNPIAATGGEDAEPFEEVLLRAPHDLRTRDRAVSAEDFAHLAKETPGVPIQRAYALARTRHAPEADEPFPPQDGAVTVVVLPIKPGPTPSPSEAELAQICAHLEPRRLITTELYVTGPRYARLELLSARLKAAPEADLAAVEGAARTTVLDYLHPLTGGEDGAGWPFGAPIAHGALYRRLLAVDGVRRVEALEVVLDRSPPPGSPNDVTPVPPGHLPYLPATGLDLKASYDART